jgi:general secretion pathway protein G
MSKILKMLNKKVRKDNKGFTLVELLVVIAIIGILAAVAVPTIFGNVEKSKASKVASDYNAIKTAVLTYYNETGGLPASGDFSTTLKDYIDTNPVAPNGGTYTLETSTDGKTCNLVISPATDKTISQVIVDKLDKDLDNSDGLGAGKGLVTGTTSALKIKLVD